MDRVVIRDCVSVKDGIFFYCGIKVWILVFGEIVFVKVFWDLIVVFVLIILGKV